MVRLAAPYSFISETEANRDSPGFLRHDTLKCSGSSIHRHCSARGEATKLSTNQLSHHSVISTPHIFPIAQELFLNAFINFMAASINSLRASTGLFKVTRAIARPQIYSGKPLFTTSYKAVTPFKTPSSIRTLATDLERKAMDKDQSRGESTEGISEWKQRAPYKVHESNDNFKARYEASCHCGKVKYQLSREEPLDSKLCHCTTCQTQHGMFTPRRRAYWV